MNKFTSKLLVLAGCIATLSSCLKNDYYERTQTAMGYNIYVSVRKQNVMTMDPFNVAFRLNTLIEEGNGDPNQAPDSIKNLLCTAETTITFDEVSGIYTLTYTGSPTAGDSDDKDFIRKGTICIKTNGYPTLGTPSAQWEIDFNTAPTYSIFSNGDEIKLTASSYTISNTGDNNWTAYVSRFISSVPSVSEDGTTYDYKSNWDGSYQFTQSSGTQKLADVQNAIFTINSTNSGTTMYYPNDNMTVSTPTPFRYNPQCSTVIPVGDGKMIIFLSNDPNLENYTEAQLLGGSETNVCNPKTQISYGGYVTEYLIQ